MTTKRLIALLLCAAMMLTLFAGCGKNNDNKDNSSDPDSSSSDKNSENNGDVDKTSAGDKSYADFVYVPVYSELKLPEKTRVSRIVAAGDLFYMLCHEVVGQETVSGGIYDKDDLIDDDLSDDETGDADDTDDVIDPMDPDKPMLPGSYTYDVYGPALYTMKKDFTGLTKLDKFAPTEIPEGKQGNANVNQIIPALDGTIWVTESVYTYSVDENGNYIGSEGQRFYIRHLDKDGSDIAQMVANDMFPDAEWLYINAMTVTDDGRFIMTNSNDGCTKIVDSDGNVLDTIELNIYVENYIKAGGEIFAIYWGDTGYSMAKLDLQAKKLGDPVSLPRNVWNTIPGSKLYDCYFSNEIALYGFDIETEETTMLINWLSSDIDSDEMYNIWVDDDGAIYSLNSDWSGENVKYTVARFEKADPATLPEKITLTLGCNYIDYTVRSQIIKFNRANDKYRIEMIDYSQYNTEDDYNAGLTKLNTEIISGKAPDMLVSQSLPMELYASKGLFEDLYPYIDSDSELGGGKLMADALKAAEYNGKLYEAFPSFYLSSIVAPSNVVGYTPGWTAKQLMELKSRMPAGMKMFCNRTRQDILYTLLNSNLDSYINWATGECKFDTGEFALLLEFVNEFPQDFNWETDYVDVNKAIVSGQCLLSEIYIEDFHALSRYKALYNGDVTCIGFPSENSCGTIFSVSTSIAMSSVCKDKAGAWEFMRTMFTESYQNDNVWWGFPTNKAVFDKKKEEAMEQRYYTDENGEQVPEEYEEWYIDENTTIRTYAPTEAEVQQLIDLIAAVGESGTRYAYDDDIVNMITEEAEFYFAGQKSAADVANIIQSRVKIYVSEHM